ncbi:hypothetical protein BD626DRAFT_501587 [Schizophyllum amplum]|uniref:FAD/NAD(P)-binding domain-containing protein n=1 Tax=Schizophyllum amplum TaxID=97359 RepID=A0A550C9Y3_9AGAR|nr:hypothetical protein BD626DRAFT_501587 [Auriculariopsis ampla]
MRSEQPREQPSGGATPVFRLGQFAIDEPRRMKVVVIGAGYSGITAGIRFRQHIPNLDLTIYEANAGIGGTWYSNKYPGLACDSASHQPNWSRFYAPGPEILAYMQHVVDKWKLMSYIKLRHRLVRAEWAEEMGKWMLTIRRSDDSEFQETADVLFTGIGLLSRWSWPNIDGLRTTFKGPVIHSAQWETADGGETWEASVKNWADKKVGVIGVGSSGIQIVSALQPHVAKLVNFVRGNTWISGPFASNTLQELAGDTAVDNYTFSEADKEKFKDPKAYHEFRHDLEAELNAAYAATMRGSEGQIMGREHLTESMKKKLAKKPWIADHLVPQFGLACRRLTPGPGYLEALCEDNVDFIPSPIKFAAENGLVTEDGQYIDLDIIVCATGYDTSFQLGFPFIGRGGVELKDKYTPHPKTYLSIAVDGFPNWFQSFGPNSAMGSGSLLAVIEKQVEYAVKATAKLQRERLKSMAVKKEAAEDFDEYLEAFFPTTVFSEPCKSWYKNGNVEGRISALYPGSTLHFTRALEHPRWEDYEYEALDSDNRNRFFWLGNGGTVSDFDPNGDKAFYLNNVDIPPVPEYDNNAIGGEVGK